MDPNSPDTALTIAVAKGFGELIAKLTPTVVAAAGSQLKEAFGNLSASYGPHLAATFERCTKIKTLMSLDEPIELLSIYVRTHFKCGNRTLDDYAVIEEIRNRKHAVISGTAGGGKTIFMKYLWISYFENSKGKIPIFLELRRINDITTDNLRSFIYHSISQGYPTIPEDKFDRALNRGLFIFIFDGFDEVVDDKRDEVERQILELAFNNPECIFVVSGRVDDRFDSWQSFSNYKVQPLDKEGVIALVNKVEFDKIIKKKFIERIKKDLYEKHQSFLSTPLLATLMLLTFNQFADIPEKIHVFYDQAFDTLFARHDATKEAFKRKMASGLPIDVFKRYVSHFCLLTYYAAKFEFSDEETLDFLRKGLRIENESPSFVPGIFRCVLSRASFE